MEAPREPSELKPFLRFTVLPHEDGQMLQSVLRTRFGVSRALIRSLKADDCALADGRPIAMRSRLSAGSEVTLRLPSAKASTVRPEPIPIDIVAEDDHVLILDKPVGLLVHPAGRTLGGTLANGVAHHLLQRGEPSVAGPVSRLDRGTSGLVLFAKHPHAHFRLSSSLARGEVRRRYTAIVHGIIEGPSGVIDAPIRKARPDQVRRVVAADGQQARTRFVVAARYPNARIAGGPPGATLLRLSLETGRTHQIRVHLAHIGHPVIGDPLYGPGTPDVIDRQALHAGELEFVHPADGEWRRYHSPLPDDLVTLVRLIEAM